MRILFGTANYSSSLLIINNYFVFKAASPYFTQTKPSLTRISTSLKRTIHLINEDGLMRV